jgi:hypothetical protein
MADEIKARPAEQVGAGQHLAVQRLGPVGADLDRASSRARRTRPGVTQRRLARPVLPLFRAFAVAMQQEHGMPLARARRERVGRPRGLGSPTGSAIMTGQLNEHRFLSSPLALRVTLIVPAWVFPTG